MLNENQAKSQSELKEREKGSAKGGGAFQRQYRIIRLLRSVANISSGRLSLQEAGPTFKDGGLRGGGLTDSDLERSLRDDTEQAEAGLLFFLQGEERTTPLIGTPTCCDSGNKIKTPRPLWIDYKGHSPSLALQQIKSQGRLKRLKCSFLYAE